MLDGIHFQVSQARDPNGKSLRQLLEAQLAYERMQATGHLLFWALVPVGTLVWIASMRPGFLPPWLVHLGEAGWVGVLVCLATTTAKARRCGARARRFAAESRSPDSFPGSK